MPELTPELVAKIEKTHDKVIEIATVLGNGKEGLLHNVSRHEKRIWRLEIVLAFLLGGGGLVGGGIGLVKWLGG